MNDQFFNQVCFRKILQLLKSFQGWMFVASFAVSACASDTALPAQTMEAYYQALAKNDLNTMIALACPEWEEQARNEYQSFGAVTIDLEDVRCETESLEGSNAIVRCRGKILANYGNEVLEIDLTKLSFLVVQQGGNWRFCGYP